MTSFFYHKLYYIFIRITSLWKCLEMWDNYKIFLSFSIFTFIWKYERKKKDNEKKQVSRTKIYQIIGHIRKNVYVNDLAAGFCQAFNHLLGCSFPAELNITSPWLLCCSPMKMKLFFYNEHKKERKKLPIQYLEYCKY